MSKLLEAIAEVSFGGMLPFSAESVAFQLHQTERTVKKQMKKLKAVGAIEPFEIGMYPSDFFTVSGEWFDNPVFQEKRERILSTIKENISNGNLVLPLPEPLSNDIACKIWDVRGKPISPNQY